MKQVTNFKPYYLRALYDWFIDNELVPLIGVDTSVVGVTIPSHLYQKQPVLFNLGVSAVVRLHFGNEVVTFKSRFNGVSHEIFLPIESILFIFDKEGNIPSIPILSTVLIFDSPQVEKEAKPEPKKKPMLHIIK